MEFPPNPVNAEDASLQRAWQLFDGYNRRDPNLVSWNGAMQPREWLHAQFLQGWVAKLAPRAGAALRLAARCQHIGRWEVPREACPAGRTGYLQWRNTLKEHHANVAARLLASAGHDAQTIQAVLKIIRKQGIKRDADVQCMENALCLVFLEHQYEEFCERYPDKVVAVLQKTWHKMDEAGRQAAASLSFSERGQAYLAAALAGGEEAGNASS
ncbi:DUF4202 domain-containing protein [Achromobacter sp. PD1]|jgi:hypothetical protein|uniref:DUF4202 domain-containing protein n=1 Tax=Achromobacter sp. PD1 TaxID=3399125 RepID=UPI003AF654D3